MTGKPLPFSHRSRSNGREHQNHSTHQGTEVQINSHKITQNPITEIATSNQQVKTVHHTQDQIFKLIHNIILDHNHLTIIETEIAHDNCSHGIDFVMLENKLIHY